MIRRILLLITDLEIGGTPTVVRELATRLHRPPGVIVEVACLSKWGPVADQLQRAGITVNAFNCTRPWQFPVALYRLVQLIRNRQYDTVFSFLIHANAVSAAASLIVREVGFHQSVQTTQVHPLWHWCLQGLIHGAAERIVGPSFSTMEASAMFARVPHQKFVIIPNAVDPASFTRSTIPETNLRPYPIGFIGRLDPIKRIPSLIQAVASLKGQVHLHIFGDGRERELIQAEIHQRNLSHHVTMHGTIADPRSALSQIGLLILPSLAEGFGLVLIEAMAAGVPVIGANTIGISDVVRHGQNGLLTTLRSKQDLHADLSDLIKQVIEDPELRKRLIRGGYEFVNSHCSWDIVLPQYKALLRIA